MSARVSHRADRTVNPPGTVRIYRGRRAPTELGTAMAVTAATSLNAPWGEVTPPQVFHDETLTDADVRVYAYLAEIRAGDDVFECSAGRLAKKMGCSIRKVQYSFARLVAAGHLIRERQFYGVPLPNGKLLARDKAALCVMPGAPRKNERAAKAAKRTAPPRPMGPPPGGLRRAIPTVYNPVDDRPASPTKGLGRPLSRYAKTCTRESSTKELHGSSPQETPRKPSPEPPEPVEWTPEHGHLARKWADTIRERLHADRERTETARPATPPRPMPPRPAVTSAAGLALLGSSMAELFPNLAT